MTIERPPELSEELVEQVAVALYEFEFHDEHLDVLYRECADHYRARAVVMLTAARTRGTHLRLLNILGRASNVVEISWSVPEQPLGSLLDTLLASIVALGEAIKPPLEDDGGTSTGSG